MPRVSRYSSAQIVANRNAISYRRSRESAADQAVPRARALTVFGHEDWMAPIASGSNPADAMAICPCTVGTLGAIAAGLADNLIERAADVMLKERRPLVLVPRETPLSDIHLENMLKLAHAGAAIVPPAPGFYDRPQTVAELVDFVVARVLDQLGVAHALGPRWGEARVAPGPDGASA
jgi:4-hydroxy-3-polyprenylbenzoate decarboxylase